jgi:hypothetical protein
MRSYVANDAAVARERLAKMCRADSVVCLQVLLGIVAGHLDKGRTECARDAFERACEVATELNISIR